MKKRNWVAVSLALVLGAGSLAAASSLLPFMPRAEDFTLLWWENGPQHFYTMKTPSPKPVLCLQSGAFGVVLDTKSVQLLHVGRFPKPQDIEGALRASNAGLFNLPPARNWSFRWQGVERRSR